MWQALMAIMKYKGAIPVAIDLIQTIQATGADKKLTKTERSLLLKKFWSLVKEVERVNPPKIVEHPKVEAK